MKKYKIRSMGVVNGSRDLLFEFSEPLHISGTVRTRNFKFGTNIDDPKPLTKKCKIRSKGSGQGHVTYF